MGMGMGIYYNDVRIGKENADSLKAALLNNTFVSDDERTIEDLMYDLYCVYVDTDDKGYYTFSWEGEVDEQDMDEMTETIAPFVKDGSYIIVFVIDEYTPYYRQYYFKNGKCEMYWAELFFEGSPMQRVAL